MPRVVQKVSSLDALQRDELLRLQRDYRRMEYERKAYVEEAGTTVSRQQDIVRFLEKERADLLTDLVNALSPRNAELDTEAARHILHILDQFAEYQTEIEHQLGQISEMEEQVDKITRRAIQQKLKLQALFGEAMTVAKADKRIRNLENNLYHVTVLRNTQVHNNKQMREEIDNNLKERGRFHYRFEFNKKKIARMKAQMGDLVYAATNTYDQREEATSKIRALRDRNDLESKKHVLEMKEYQRVLDHDEKCHAFLVTKAKPRQYLEDDEVRRQRLDKAKEKHLDDLLMTYKVSFRDILVFANSRNVEILVQKYEEQEQQNFAKFKYISDLNQEVETIQDTIRFLKAEIEEKCNQQKLRRTGQEKTLLGLDEAYQNLSTELSHLVAQWEFTESSMAKIIAAIDEVFVAADCGNEPIIRLLGNRNGITPRNAALCMGVIEHRVTELLYEKSILELRRFVEIDGGQLPSKGITLQGTKAKPTGGPFKPKVIITGRLDAGGGSVEDDDEDERVFETRPIPYAEMRAMLLAKLQLGEVRSDRAESTHSLSSTGVDHKSRPSGPNDTRSEVIHEPETPLG